MRGRIALIVSCGVFLTGCDAFSTKPKHYLSAAGKFSVEFPRTPKESEQNIPTAAGTIKANTVMAQDRKQVTYSVTYSDYPANLVNSGNIDAVLEGAATGMVTAVKGTMTEKQPISLEAYPGRGFRFQVKPEGSTETGIGVRIYMVGNRLYQVLVAGSDKQVDLEATKRFFDSFQLEGKKTSSTTAAGALAPSEATATRAAQGESDWGTAEDPLGDCRFQVEGQAVTIEVPGTLHNLTAQPGQDNAPRIVRPVDGDFVAEVKVTGNELPADPPAPPSQVPFHGAGLLLWGDAGNFIRLERAAFVRGGQLRTYVLFERHAQGAPMQGQDFTYAGGPVFLRMTRRGSQVLGAFSLDGTNWQELAPKEFMSQESVVGVAAVNTASLPFRARFEGLDVRKP